MKKVKKIAKIIAQIIPYLFFLLAVLIVVDIVSALRNDETPSIFGYGAAIVVSPSMEDTILEGDLIVYRSVNPDTLDVGDIIIFWRPDMTNPVTVTHRIVAITPDTGNGRLFTTAGDNNNSSLDWEIEFSEAMIIGEYIGRSTVIGAIYSALFGYLASVVASGNIYILYPFLAILFLLFAVIETKKIVSEMSKAKQKQLDLEKAQMVADEVKRLRKEIEDAKTKE
ncbi:MAG: signal peptidase I [Candidatus Izemoplasmatales bacterium]|jgi:signal peptidase|nr:signal peptidase I [Candidatus Izemoplasmatales bacterium]